MNVDQKRVLFFLAALLEREGGQVTLPIEDLKKIADRLMLFDEETLPGFVTVTLVPEFIQIGIERAPAPRTLTDEELARLLKKTKRDSAAKLKSIEYYKDPGYGLSPIRIFESMSDV